MRHECDTKKFPSGRRGIETKLRITYFASTTFCLNISLPVEMTTRYIPLCNEERLSTGITLTPACKSLLKLRTAFPDMSYRYICITPFCTELKEICIMSRAGFGAIEILDNINPNGIRIVLL